ncbi:hypothetical protein CDG60_06160 [Acinetobacter chinensis]|uniref:Zona occludens toxin N-terminal domain-containing protein n=1 Tax=Acinetobacter chinensis TaxID=2004650 RepID=A0A3B7LTL2_9GAMM|nr:zonular occludens toxin domain-containing protein [Acinetobacter chinensis]AXY56192.1 hypothetical protein CDG60_06160 [Acinetobacter chinensis]
MTQTLISAPPRTGKTQYAVYLIDQLSKKYPDRIIFTNIIGMNYPGVVSIRSTTHKPFDWRDLPNGSILFYDECHEHPAFSDEDLLKDMTVDVSEYDSLINKVGNGIVDNYVLQLLTDYLSYNDFDDDSKSKLKSQILHEKSVPREIRKSLIDHVNVWKKRKLIRAKEAILDIGRSLTLHGHFGIDIYMITQDVKRVNSAIKSATSLHLVLRRMYGWQCCFIFEYPEVQTYFGSSNRKNATSWRVFRYRKNLYKYYISAEQHHTKARIPLGLASVAAIPFALWGYAYYDAKQKNTLGIFGEKEPISATSKDQSPGGYSVHSEETKTKMIVEKCIEDKQMTAEQCRVSFDPAYSAQRNNALQQQTGNSMQQVVFDYNPNKPYDANFTANYNPTDFPRLSATIIYNGKCHAYNQQGTQMYDISDADCMRFASGDRPFDYFKQQNLNTQNNNTMNQQNVNQNISTVSLSREELAKYQLAKEQGLI